MIGVYTIEEARATGQPLIVPPRYGSNEKPRGFDEAVETVGIVVDGRVFKR